MANLSKEGNIQHKLGFAGLLITLGIVFGDIGTSPLYVMKAIIHTGEALDENYVLGALSCIIWTLTLQTTVKYVLVALRADNNGVHGLIQFLYLLCLFICHFLFLLYPHILCSCFLSGINPLSYLAFFTVKYA